MQIFSKSKKNFPKNSHLIPVTLLLLVQSARSRPQYSEERARLFRGENSNLVQNLDTFPVGGVKGKDCRNFQAKKYGFDAMREPWEERSPVLRPVGGQPNWYGPRQPQVGRYSAEDEMRTPKLTLISRPWRPAGLQAAQMVKQALNHVPNEDFRFGPNQNNGTIRSGHTIPNRTLVFLESCTIRPSKNFVSNRSPFNVEGMGQPWPSIKSFVDTPCGKRLPEGLSEQEHNPTLSPISARDSQLGQDHFDGEDAELFPSLPRMTARTIDFQRVIAPYMMTNGSQQRTEWNIYSSWGSNQTVTRRLSLPQEQHFSTENSLTEKQEGRELEKIIATPYESYPRVEYTMLNIGTDPPSSPFPPRDAINLPWRSRIQFERSSTSSGPMQAVDEQTFLDGKGEIATMTNCFKSLFFLFFPNTVSGFLSDLELLKMYVTEGVNRHMVNCPASFSEPQPEQRVCSQRRSSQLDKEVHINFALVPVQVNCDSCDNIKEFLKTEFSKISHPNPTQPLIQSSGLGNT